MASLAVLNGKIKNPIINVTRTLVVILALLGWAAYLFYYVIWFPFDLQSGMYQVWRTRFVIGFTAITFLGVLLRSIGTRQER